MSKKPPAFLKGKKVSEVFLEYVKPLLKDLITTAPKGVTSDDYYKALQVPWVIWNISVLKNTKNAKLSPPELDEMEERFSRTPGAKELFDRFTERKQTLFKQYDYMLGKFSIQLKDGEINLHVTATEKWSM